MEEIKELEKRFRILKKLGITKKQVAEKLGYSDAYISKMLSGERPISDNFAELFQETYDDLISKYLIDNNLTDDPTYESTIKGIADRAIREFKTWRGVPIYDTQVSAGMLSIFRDEDPPEPSYYLPIPNFKDCLFGARVNGDSMYPEIRSGDFIICKEVTDFIYGDIYMVVTADGQETVKRVYSNDDPTKINLVPSNKEIPVTPILKDNIIKIYKVKGVIKCY